MSVAGFRWWGGLRDGVVFRMGRGSDIPRSLRRRCTGAERAAWGILRNRGLLNLKFRRQHRIGRLVVDFYCAELRLAIEVDGGYHDTSEQRSRDAARTSVLRAHGVRLVRIRNSQVSVASLTALIHPFVPPLRVSGEGDRG